MKAELEECREENLKVHRAPSLILSQEPAGLIVSDVAPSGDRERKLYLGALGCGKDLKRYNKLTVKLKETNRRKQSRDY